MNIITAHLQKYYGIYLLIIAALFLILWYPNRSVNRYAISGNANDMVVWIVDTTTGQTWWKRKDGVFNLGTVNTPIREWTTASGPLKLNGVIYQPSEKNSAKPDFTSIPEANENNWKYRPE